MKFLTLLLAFCTYFGYSQSETFYSLNLDSVQYEFQRTGSDEEFSEIYSVMDSLNTPKYLIYVIISILGQDNTEYTINDLYEDEKFVYSLYNRLNCYPINNPTKKIRGNTIGFENQIKFENKVSKEGMPGLLFSALKQNKLFHVLFMVPNQKMFLSNENEIYAILNSLKL